MSNKRTISIFLLKLILFTSFFGGIYFSISLLVPDNHPDGFISESSAVFLILLGCFITISIRFLKKDKRFSAMLLLGAFPVTLAGEWLLLTQENFSGVFFLLSGLVMSFSGTLFLGSSGILPDFSSTEWRAGTRKIALVFLVGLTVFLKSFSFTTCLPGIDYDEAVKGTVASGILEGITRFRPYISQKESPFYYLVALSMKCFGPSKISMRLTSTIIACTALILFFVLIKKMFNFESAFFASFFFTISLWHNNICRITQRLVLVPLIQILILLLIFQIYKSRRWIWYPLLGISMAAAFYSYPPARIFNIVLPIAILYMLVRSPRLALKQWWCIALLIIFFFVFLVAPLGKNAADWQDYFLNPGKLGFRTFSFSKLFSLEKLHRLKQTFPLLIRTWNYRTAPGGTLRPVNTGIPLLGSLTSIFFVIGAGVFIARIKQFNYFLWVASFLGGIIPGIMMFPFQRRLICATLVAFVFAAMGFMALWEVFVSATRNYSASQKIQKYILFLILILLSVSHWKILDKHLFHFKAWYPLQLPYDYTAQLLKKEYEVVFIGNFQPPRYNWAYFEHRVGNLKFRRRHIHYRNGAKLIPYKETVKHNLAYVVNGTGNAYNILQKIKKAYPHCIHETVKYNGKPLIEGILIAESELNK